MKVALAFLSNTLFNFIIGLLLARFLGPEDYGLFALAIAVAVMIQTVAFDWARLAAARFYSERVRAENPSVRATLDSGLALIILTVAVASVAMVMSGLTVSISPTLAALSVGVAISNGLFDYSTALVRARFRDSLYARLVTAKNVLSLLLTVGGAYWFGSAQAALLGVVLSMAGSLLGLGRKLVDPRMSARADKSRAVAFVRYGMPIVLANLFYQSIPLVDRVVLAKSFGLAQSGQFSFAYDVGVRIVAAVGSMLDVLLFQIAVRVDETLGVDEARRQIGRNIGFVVAVLLPACVGLWLVLPSLELIVVPPEFRGAFARDLALLMPGLFCYGLIFFALHPLFQITKRTGPLVAVAIGASGANLAGIALLPSATTSFPIAQAAAFLLATGVLLIWSRTLSPSWPKLRDLGGTLIATAIMAGVVRLGDSLLSPGPALLGLQVVAGGLVYLAAALVLDLCEVGSLVRDLRHQLRHQVAE